MTHPADLAPAHLRSFVRRHDLVVEFLAPGAPMPTVASAAAAIDVPVEQILKTLLFTSHSSYVIAVANGLRRVDPTLLAAASGLARPRAASPEIVDHVTGYPAGGVAPLGLPEGLLVVVDSGVAALSEAFGGGGRKDVLMRVSIADVIRVNHALVRPIVANS